ncbi:NADP-dependent oxidoreductase [Pelagibacteraceae bacterium]|nr:NADP-dependent oxidoreductase [Pelagibacteraceae bacterium]
MQNKQWILNSFPVGEIKDNDLIFKDSNLAEINDGEVLIKNIYLSLDPANRGWMSGKASYVDAMQIGDIMRGGTIGIIEESRNEKFKKGDAVQYQGGWQEYCINDGKGLRVIPLNTGLELPSFLSVMGMPGMTAYFGLLDVLKPEKNETLVVSGAAGAVGSLVSQIAKIKGCRVIGIAGTEEKCNWLKNDLKVDGVINYKTDNLNSTLKELCPNGIDMYFDNVGGEITEAVINRFNIGGRMSICGQISGYNSETLQPGPRNWINILVKRLKVQGFIVFDYQARAKEAFVDMSKWMAEGKLQHKNHIVDGLENAVSSLKMLFSGENKGKMIVKISNE